MLIKSPTRTLGKQAKATAVCCYPPAHRYVLYIMVIAMKNRLYLYKRFNGLSFIHLLYCLRTKSAYNRGEHREYGQ